MARLTALDVQLERDGDRLRLSGPKGAVTPELRHELAARKQELMALLRGGIAPAPDDAEIPLTSGQERLWTLMRLQRESGVYNVPMVYRLEGALAVDALERSLREIERRHSILRTTFPTVAGTPRQRVGAPAARGVELEDLSDATGADRDATAAERMAAEILRPFDIANGPLWRCTLLRLAADEHLLILTWHHLVFDRFSKTVFLRELETLYAGGTLPEVPVQYGDYACWQASDAQRQLVDGRTDYWKTKLAGTVTELLLPTDRPRPSSIAPAGRSRAFTLPAALTAELAALNRATRTSMYMALLAAFHALLYRYSGQTDQIICSPVACRTSTSSEAMIGYFNNILPMRTDLSGDPTLRELLGRVRQTLVDAIRHQDVPFQRISSLPSAERTPLTRGMFNFRGEDTNVLNLPGLAATPVESRRPQADFDLALYMGIEDGVIGGVLDYNAEIFEEDTIRTLLVHHQAVLETLAADPDRRLSGLPSLRHRFADIENTLVGHPKIEEAAVVVRSDARGPSNLVAYLVLGEDEPPTREELGSALDAALEPGRSRPALIPLDELPKQADGGLDLAALPAPALDRRSSDHEYVAPRTELERQLADIWQRVLWREEKVGIHDNFFELGGHSLLSVQLLAETEKHLQRPLPLAALGQLSTIAAFIDCLERAGEEEVVEDPRGLDAGVRDQLRSFTVAWKGRRTRPESLIVGRNTDGCRQPVFWGIQRHLNLEQLAKHLGADQPIYGMRSAHGVMDRTPENIRDLAHYYADEILEIHAGPFIVGGICQAAEIAMQVALRLRALGHEPSLLGLQERFVAEDYPGRVAFFFGDASNRSPYHHYARPELGWRKFYTGGFEAHTMRGAHGTYFQEANIRSLAEEMRTAFERAPTGPADAPETGPELQRLDGSAYRAELTVGTPTEVGGDKLTLAVGVRNASPDLWMASERSGVFLGARWLGPDPDVEDRFARYVQAAQARTPLPRDLGPGDAVELELVVDVPEDRRLATVEVDLVDEGITWFGDAGSTPTRIQVPGRPATRRRWPFGSVNR